MLRITRIPGSTPTVKLEGKLLAAWTDEVRSACLPAYSQLRPSLDLSELSYVDASGAKLLQELLSQGVGVVACSHFVATLLRAENL